jgi:hypothetical protein
MKENKKRRRNKKEDGNRGEDEKGKNKINFNAF